MKIIITLLLFTFSHIVNAQTQAPQGNPPQSGQQQGQGQAQAQATKTSKTATACMEKLKAARLAVQAGTLLPTAQVDVDLQNCRALEFVSESHGSPMDDYETKSTSDKIATCTLSAGYTSDYDSCTSTLSMYNSIVALESILLTTQTVRNASNQQSINATAATQITEGDGQNAIYDAALADNAFKKNLNREQLLAYTAAVAAMGAKLTSWKSGCGSNSSMDKSKYPPVTGTCAQIYEAAKKTSSREVTANSSAKTAFSTALVGFLAKAAKAKAAMDALTTNSAVVAAAQAATATTDTTATLEYCLVNPTDEECVTASGRTAAATYSSSDFSVGDGTGTNSFDLGSSTDETTATDGTVIDSNGTVSDVTTPFNSEVQNANDILDPAAAASTSASTTSGAGGGGVGGGLGGGGASLGNDLQGEQKEKASEIKSASATGAYKSGGGESFRAIAGSKDENPFASLFDNGSKGGLEEDQSISNDDGTESSGLFQKISDRYQKVSKDNRLDLSVE